MGRSGRGGPSDDDVLRLFVSFPAATIEVISGDRILLGSDVLPSGALTCSCEVEESIECDISDIGGFLPRLLDSVLGGVGFDVVLGGVGLEDEVGGVKIDLSFLGDGG